MNTHTGLLLSVVILTRDEADNIARCLSSVSWCTDIILIDQSTDDTVKIAKRLISTNHLRIFPTDNATDFAQLRNFGLTKAKHEWVLFLDADEEVPEALYHEIQKTIPTTYDGFFLKRRDFFLGKWLAYGETQNIQLLKLGKKSAGRWKRAVHETWNIEGAIGHLSQPLNHYPHPTVAEFISRINRWTTLDAQVFYDAGVRSTWWKVICYPVGKFVRNYFFKQGYRDGMPGLIMSLCMSFHSFLTRAKLYMLQSRN